MKPTSIHLALAACVAAAAPLGAQTHAGAQRAWSANVVLPQARAFHLDASMPAVEVTGIRAAIELVDGIARTTLHVDVRNGGARPAEGELLLPVPDGAAVSGFDFEGAAPTSTARVLGHEEASATYASIVAELRDPALLEFAGSALVRSSVFPVPAGGSQTIRLVYEHVMPTEGARWDYVLPRTESLAANVSWEVTVDVRSQRAIADVYSPTHDLYEVSSTPHRVQLRSKSGAALDAGPLRLSVLLSDEAVATTLFTSADPDGDGGWFLLLAGIGELPPAADLPPREVTLVIDRSGSMAGEKFDQAIAAARQVLEGLEFGEAIQIIDYSKTVERFAPAPVIKTKANLAALRGYLDGLAAQGGTNLDGALQAALAQPPTEGFLPVVLFLTDGLPTEGEQREHVIRERAGEANVHGRRVFTFGVGYDVNASLLDAVATTSRARATYVPPGEDVEVAVAGVFEDLSGPVVTDLDFDVRGADGAPDTRLVRDVYPEVLPDLYRGDRLLLVGRYTGQRVGKLRLAGTRAGEATAWNLTYDFERALPRNDFVRRLWAMRRIAALEDSLRLAGADPRAVESLKDDPKLGEIATEMLELAAVHGVLSDSTAFLALEGTELGDGATLLSVACNNGLENAGKRAGVSGVAAQSNVQINRDQAWVNGANFLYTADGQLAANPTVQTIAGRTYFRRGERWIDGSLALVEEAAAAPDREVVFGTPEHVALCQTLAGRGTAGQLALTGEILLRIDGEVVLVKPTAEEAPEASASAATGGANE